MAHWVKNLTNIMRIRVQSLVLLSGLRIWSYPELWCRSQLRSRAAAAMVQASSKQTDRQTGLRERAKGEKVCRGDLWLQ